VVLVDVEVGPPRVPDQRLLEGDVPLVAAGDAPMRSHQLLQNLAVAVGVQDPFDDWLARQRKREVRAALSEGQRERL
jgi:hypothetical protein